MASQPANVNTTDATMSQQPDRRHQTRTQQVGSVPLCVGEIPGEVQGLISDVSKTAQQAVTAANVQVVVQDRSESSRNKLASVADMLSHSKDIEHQNRSVTHMRLENWNSTGPIPQLSVMVSPQAEAEVAIDRDHSGSMMHVTTDNSKDSEYLEPTPQPTVMARDDSNNLQLSKMPSHSKSAMTVENFSRVDSLPQPVLVAGGKSQVESMQMGCTITIESDVFRYAEVSKVSLQSALLVADTLPQSENTGRSLKTDISSSSEISTLSHSQSTAMCAIQQIDHDNESVMLTDNSSSTKFSKNVTILSQPARVEQPEQNLDNNSEMTKDNPSSINVPETIQQPVSDISPPAIVLEHDIGSVSIIDNSTGIKVSKTTPQLVPIAAPQAKIMKHNNELEMIVDGSQFPKTALQPLMASAAPRTKDYTKHDRESVIMIDSIEISKGAPQPVTVPVVMARDDIKYAEVSKTTMQAIFTAGTFPQSEDTDGSASSIEIIPKPVRVSPPVKPLKHDIGSQMAKELVSTSETSMERALVTGMLPQLETDGYMKTESDTFGSSYLEVPATNSIEVSESISSMASQVKAFRHDIRSVAMADNSSTIELFKTTPQPVVVYIPQAKVTEHSNEAEIIADGSQFSKMTVQHVRVSTSPPMKEYTKHDRESVMTTDNISSCVEISKSDPQPVIVLVADGTPQAESVRNNSTKDDIRRAEVSKAMMQPVLVTGTLSQSEDTGESRSISGSMEVSAINPHSVEAFPQVIDTEQDSESVLSTDNSNSSNLSKTISPSVNISPQLKHTKQDNKSVNIKDDPYSIEVIPQPVCVSQREKSMECDIRSASINNSTDAKTTLQLVTASPQVKQSTVTADRLQASKISLQPVGSRINVTSQTKICTRHNRESRMIRDNNSSHVENSNCTPQSLLTAGAPLQTESLQTVGMITTKEPVVISKTSVQPALMVGMLPKSENTDGLYTFNSLEVPALHPHVDAFSQINGTQHDCESIGISDSTKLSKATLQHMPPQLKDTKQENRYDSLMTKDNNNSIKVSETIPQLLSVPPEGLEHELLTITDNSNFTEFSNVKSQATVTVSPQARTMKQNNESAMIVDGVQHSKMTVQNVGVSTSPQMKDYTKELVMTTDNTSSCVEISKSDPQPATVLVADRSPQTESVQNTITTEEDIRYAEISKQPVAVGDILSQSEDTNAMLQPSQANGAQLAIAVHSSELSKATPTSMPPVENTEQNCGSGKTTESATCLEPAKVQTDPQTHNQTVDKPRETQTDTTSDFQFQSSAIIRETELNAYIKRMNIHECKNGETPLHLASRSGLLNAVKVLIEEFDFNPNVRDTNYQETPLHYASQFGNARIVKYFIEHGCDAEIKDMNNLTPLHYASRHGHLDITKYLSSIQGCSLEARDNHQQTPLHYACHFGHLDIVIFFVRIMGCDAETMDEEMRTPLHIACKYRHSEIVHYLVHEQKCNPNADDINKRTPLHYACIWWYHIKYDHDMSVSHKVAEELLTHIRCDINKTTRDGDTALHLACKVDRLDIVRHLLSKPSCNPNTMNKRGQTPLQLASHLNVIAELTSKGANPILSIMYKWHKSESDVRTPFLQSWSPEQVRELTQSVKTPQDLLSWVIGKVTEDQALEVFLIIVRHTCLDLNVLFSDGYNALHIACKANKPNIVKCLLSQGNCNPNKKTSFGNTPLSLCSSLPVAKQLLQHQAHPTTFLRSLICKVKKNGYYLLDSMKYLTENARWEMDIALQLACEANQPEIVRFLLAERKCNPNSVNSAKRTPLQLTSDPDVIKELLRYGANPMDVYRFHGKILGTKQPLCPSVKIFIVGNPAVGKSTLTAALQKEPFWEILSIARKVSGVDEKTAGVIPYEFESKKCGRITLYDFAGQREFYGSHAALLRNAIQSSPPIFLLVVNVNEENEMIKKNIIYWLSFIDNQCISVVNKPHIIIIGSHADLIQARGEDPKEKESIIGVALKEALLSSMEYVGFVPMNCCYSNSPGMRRLRNFMKESCSTVRSQAVSFRVHCFQVYLHDKFRNHIAVRLKLIQKQTRSDVNSTIELTRYEGDQDITFTSFVPTDLNELCKFCKELNDQGHILFLDDSSNAEDGWVIIDKSSLLSEVTGTIFAPATFKEHRNLASSTGVVPLSKIKEHFPNHDPDMLVGYLSHLEFCHEISDISILKLIYEQEISMSSERYFFFPALVTIQIPKKVWKAKPQQFAYHCGWILQCSKPDRFFTSRFLEVLLLRLAFSFALAKSPNEADQNFPAIQRECSIWINGIFWGNRLGPEVLVEVYFNEAVIILMRCEDIHIMECIACRPKIIIKVLQCAKEFCPKVQTEEFFIDPSEVTQYPLVKKSLSELTLFSIQKIANTAISSDQMNLVHTTGAISLKCLLELEPYAILNNSVLEKLLKEPESKTVSDYILNEISECSCANANFIKMFNPRPGLTNSESNLYNVLRKWRDECDGTYLCLREKLDQYSIFAGRGSDIFVSLL